MSELVDLQNAPDDRGIPIDRVGISKLTYPIVVMDRAQGKQESVGEFSMSVSLPHHFKGTHMSRFLEVLHESYGEITVRTLPTILQTLAERLDAREAELGVRFTYFLEKAAPVTGARALANYWCAFQASLDPNGTNFMVAVDVPVTTLCPCSKIISDYGAHNQRGSVLIKVRSGLDTSGEPHLIWIEELIGVAEASASAPVYPLLKRSDERFVTMQAYDNPVFVEDVARNVAQALQADERIVWFEVISTNEESIHNHAAFASIAWSRPCP